MSKKIIFANYKQKIEDLNYNTVPYSISLSKDTLIPNKLEFSINGIDSFFTFKNKFELNKIYFSNQPIHFVVRVKTSNNIPVKNIDILKFNSKNKIELKCIDINDNQIDANFYENFHLDTNKGGYFKGYCTINTNKQISSLRFYATANIDNKYSLEGYSSFFDIYPEEGKNKIRKINEDFSLGEYYRSLIYQNNLTNRPKLFGTSTSKGLLNSIGGEKDDDTQSFGIKIYEKISNYNQNIQDIEYNNLRSLESSLQLINIPYEELFTNFPQKLQRLADIFSINFSKLKGFKNQYKFDFDDRGLVYNNNFGKNLGENIDFKTKILTAGPQAKPIVAYERFSENYTLLETNLLSVFDFRYRNRSTLTYNLSDYSSEWGWKLIIPREITTRNFFKLQDGKYLTYQDGFYRLKQQNFISKKSSKLNIENFYDFYEFVDVTDNTFVEKYIDFENENNSIPLSSFTLENFTKDGGIQDEMLLHTIYSDTDIIKA